ncbi:alpha/beta hydrolase [Lactiplantibacillus fabifermentans]|uniref:Cell surface hydrolase n=2 Tax=Lactiplantibacillus fabifermentans TaxID=483011 RepID=A0A0R2NVT9_9LACO|nr:alpha/beta hydrolase [Lactiplantibacillus fabifermentans]ETY74844.1 acyltransferase [Lactiplantibacillus fabifermentans T30PCM01]KRO28432.1 cell surface hydrolase [Lactiplantibacillus fabifermentans DSM 21115]
MKTNLNRQRRRRSLIVLIIGSVLLALLVWPSYQWTQANVSSMTGRHDSRLSPVIMIPGSSATQNRFDRLVTQLNTAEKQKHSLLKITVKKDDTIKYSGTIRPRDNEPFIVVGFENNKDGYSNIKQQARWFSLAFNALARKYQFNNFKAIGHSNGGLIYTYFFEHYFKRDDITVKKVMTIGSPYNFSEANLNHKTQMLADFIKYRHQLPSKTTVYSVAGTENYDTDGLVPARSVEAGKYIYQGQVKHFTEITVTGDNAQHSDLPQNKQIVTLIKEYILDKKQTKANKGLVGAGTE